MCIHIVRATRVASKQRGLNRREYLQPRKSVRTEVAVRVIVTCRSIQFREKADVLEEEMRKCTPRSTGVWGQTSLERLMEITLGRACYQQGLVATCKDYAHKANKWRRAEITGLAHEFVVAMNAG
jgi:hypothetical protein